MRLQTGNSEHPKREAYARGFQAREVVGVSSADETENVSLSGKLPAISPKLDHRRRVQPHTRANDKSDTIMARPSLLAIDYSKSNELITR